jgi:O-antigen ligase
MHIASRVMSQSLPERADRGSGRNSSGVIAPPIDVVHPEVVRRRRIDATALLTFYLVLLMAIPSTLIFAPLGGGGTPATLLGIVFLGWYLLNWFNSSSALARSRQPIRLAGILFFCAVMLAYTSATRQAMPTLELNAADRGVILASGWLGILLLAADGIDTMDRLKTLLRRVVMGVTAMAALGITQFFTGLNIAAYIVIPGLTSTGQYSDIQQFEGLPRPSATAAQPIEFAAVLALALPLAINQARHAPHGLRVRRWIQVALISVALPMTVSRTAILGIVIVLVVLLPTWPGRERGRAYMTLLAFAVVLRALVPGLIGTLRNLFFQIGSDSDTVSRTNGLSAAGGFIARHPWFGRGFGTFLPQTYRFLDDQYLGSLIETGIFGFLILVALFMTGWSLARRVRRMSTASVDRDLAQSLAASAAVAGLTFGTFDALGFPMATGLTFLLLGCVGAMWRLAKAGSASPDRAGAP